jgi:hypothetical protein
MDRFCTLSFLKRDLGIAVRTRSMPCYLRCVIRHDFRNSCIALCAVASPSVQITTGVSSKLCLLDTDTVLIFFGPRDGPQLTITIRFQTASNHLVELPAK